MGPSEGAPVLPVPRFAVNSNSRPRPSIWAVPPDAELQAVGRASDYESLAAFRKRTGLAGQRLL
jgi:hypothetical protein